jgi:hypothetical protein
MNTPEHASAAAQGDAPIDFREYRFRAREAAALSGVPETTVRNWEARVDGMNIGRRIAFRRLRFCLADIVQLHVMYYLSARLGIALDVAVRVGAYAAEMACLAGSPLGNSILLGFNDAGEILVGSSFIREPGRYLPPSFEQDARHVLRRPHVMIPLDAITRDIAERMDASPDRTEANEENTVDAD